MPIISSLTQAQKQEIIKRVTDKQRWSSQLILQRDLIKRASENGERVSDLARE